jgi:hypothetical protein
MVVQGWSEDDVIRLLIELVEFDVWSGIPVTVELIRANILVRYQCVNIQITDTAYWLKSQLEKVRLLPYWQCHGIRLVGISRHYVQVLLYETRTCHGQPQHKTYRRH